MSLERYGHILAIKSKIIESLLELEKDDMINFLDTLKEICLRNSPDKGPKVEILLQCEQDSKDSLYYTSLYHTKAETIDMWSKVSAEKLKYPRVSRVLYAMTKEKTFNSFFTVKALNAFYSILDPTINKDNPYMYSSAFVRFRRIHDPIMAIYVAYSERRLKQVAELLDVPYAVVQGLRRNKFKVLEAWSRLVS